MRATLDSSACRQRGPFERAYLERLFAAPAMHHTRFMGNKLGQLALFQYWLRRDLDGAGTIAGFLLWVLDRTG